MAMSKREGCVLMVLGNGSQELGSLSSSLEFLLLILLLISLLLPPTPRVTP